MTGKPLYVTENRVTKLLQAADFISLAREAYVRLAKGSALGPERLFFTIPKRASFYIMPAHVLGRKTVTVKVARLNTTNPRRHQSSVMASLHVYDSTTGAELAHLEADGLTAIRTAASSAVATDLLAPSNCEVLGVIGTGKQARAHIPPLLRVRGFSRILIHS